MSDQPAPVRVSRRQLLQLAIAANACAASKSLCQDTGTGKRIYIAADDHTDYMWTADEQAYREAFLETIDHYLDLADQTDERPHDFQCRWNCDGLLWFLEYEQHRDKAAVARLIRRIKSGHISIPLTLLVSCYGGTPTEAVLRGLYPGGRVERQYQLAIPIAVSMENQTLPYGLGMLWAGSGVRYSWKGICGCATQLENFGGQREHDVYWWLGPDGSRILMKWYSLSPRLDQGVSANEGPGGYAEARQPERAIEFIDKDAEFRRRNPHQVIGLFGQGWDDFKTIVPLGDREHSFPDVARRMTRKHRRVIVSNELDYFEDMETTHGKSLPEVGAAFGNEWDLYSASMAEVSASVKRATEKLRAAEAMATLVARYQPVHDASLTRMRDAAWLAFGMYWEHDWTADGPISRERRAAWQRKIARQIIDYVEALHEAARKALGTLISTPDGGSGGETVFVFNALGWRRTDYVDLPNGELGDRRTNINEVVVTDVESGRIVPSQIINGDGEAVVRFLATDVPAFGYRLFRIAPGPSQKAEWTVSASAREIVSRDHQIRLSTNGAIDQWRSRSLERVLISGPQAGNYLGSGEGRVRVESRGPVSTTLRVDVDRPLVRTTRVTLFESLDRIEIENTIRDNFADVKSWRYEFNLDTPETYHEEVGAILRAAFKKDGGDYADRNARTDWLTLNHFIALKDESTTITVSNRDCLFFHLGQRTSDPMESSSNVVHLLAGGQIDGPKLGIARQGGDSRFLQRFALRSRRTDAADEDLDDSMRFALEHQNPFVVGTVTHATGPLPSGVHSFATLESNSVVAWAIKPAESGEGEGTIVRLWNLSSQPSAYRLAMNWPVKQCMQTTHVETDLEPVSLSGGILEDTLAPGAMRTYRMIAE